MSASRRPRRRWPLACLATAILLPLVGCGSGPTYANAPEAQRTPKQILDDAANALRSAQSFHLSGTVDDQSTVYTFELDITGKQASGTMTVDNDQIKVWRNNDLVAIQGRDFWLHQVDAQTAARFGDQCIAINNNIDAGQQAVDAFKAFTDPDQLATQLDTPEGTLSKGDAVTVDSQKGISINDDVSSVIVQLNEPHRPLRLTKERGVGPGHLEYTKYNSQLDTTAPTGCIDAATGTVDPGVIGPPSPSPSSSSNTTASPGPGPSY